MKTVSLNQPISNFERPATNNIHIKLSALKGKNIVLYFYPKDCTSGCTQQGQDFRDNYKKFATLNTVVLGVSRDSLKLHEKFKAQENFPFELISDADETLCKQFDVIKEKNMYGKKVFGIERSTFLIDTNGVLRHEWRKVKVDGHVAEVLRTVKELLV